MNEFSSHIWVGLHSPTGHLMFALLFGAKEDLKTWKPQLDFLSYPVNLRADPDIHLIMFIHYLSSSEHKVPYTVLLFNWSSQSREGVRLKECGKPKVTK